MMWLYVGDAANWAAARMLDLAANGDDSPGWASEFGWALIALAIVVTTWLVKRWLRQRRDERDQPEPENLLASQGWLAEEGAEVPGHRYVGRRRRPRKHPVPAHPPRPEVAATQVIPRVSDDIDSTAVLTRPRGRRGAR